MKKTANGKNSLPVCTVAILKNWARQNEYDMKKTAPPSFASPSELTDIAYVEGLKAGDSTVIRRFFYGLCRHTLQEIRLSVFSNAVDYDDLVNELYLYLSEGEWRRLDTFNGENGNQLRSWMKKLSWRFFVRHKELLLGLSADECVDTEEIAEIEEPEAEDVFEDLERMLVVMENPRYAAVLRLMLVEGYKAEEVAKLLQTNVANVYNLKHRALSSFTVLFEKENRKNKN